MNHMKNSRHNTGPSIQGKKKKKVIVICLIALIVIAGVLSGLCWKHQNDQSAKQVVGMWYSESEGLQYHFKDDGSFYATNGQTKLIEGNWDSGWARETVVLRYTIDGNPRRVTTHYSLDPKTGQLTFDNINDRTLTMTRLQIE